MKYKIVVTAPHHIVATVRLIVSSSSRNFNPVLTDQELYDGCRLGIDSHADVSCVGKHASILETFTGRVFNVKPFNDSYESMKNIQTVNAAFAYDADNGQTYILEVNQALDFTKTMEHSLLCPNQSRVHGLRIDDIPTFLDITGHSTHSIHVLQHNIVIPLDLHGSISYIHVRCPTSIELEECEHIELTDGGAEWDPYRLDQSHHHIGATSVQRPHGYMDTTLADRLLMTNLYEELVDAVLVNGISHIRTNDISPESLASL